MNSVTHINGPLITAKPVQNCLQVQSCRCTSHDLSHMKQVECHSFTFKTQFMFVRNTPNPKNHILMLLESKLYSACNYTFTRVMNNKTLEIKHYNYLFPLAVSLLVEGKTRNVRKNC